MNNSANIEVDKIYQYNLYKAKNTLWYFNDFIKNESSEYNSVKFKNEKDVFVWLENVKIENKYYLGKLAENGNLKKVLVEDVIDWMIIKEGRLLGGYTIRHYRDTLDEEAKLNFDIDFGVKIDDGNDFFMPDSSTPEGAIIKIENFYSDENLDGVLSCKSFITEAENLLKERELNNTEEIKSELAEVLKLSLIEDLKLNGFPSFRDIERNFTLIEKKQNQQLIEEKIIYENGTVTFNNLWVGYINGEWKVLNLIEDPNE
ncbi:DUF2314 domain-containing protein [Chryseobacterium herbae]|uniref:DUF2314 domain-containing protein n=1 Tax=Chryseobacterium herbae TaxID=2976476 RepID=A0ABT2ISL1_9FLAO|nr:DUF2314 domain-containing protein [Chryseobacterium sp. pc1-10]MCT2561809.1 DUF2314 domain-containing protein [Chryseobacterium sp. pc1-10]